MMTDRTGLNCDTDAIKVSVIIPAYNAAATLLRAIESVRAQQGVNAEIIIVDDGSRDATVATARAAVRPGEQIRVIEMPRNSGASAARNAGIALARGEFLAFLDADDIWLPEKLARQLALIESDPGITLVSCNSEMVTVDGIPIKEGHLNRPPVNGADAWKTLLIYNFVPTPTVMTRTALVRELGGFDEKLVVGEDLDLWIKLGVRGKIAVLPQILIRYYDMNNSLMKRHSWEAATIVVPMLERHILEQDARLSAHEIRHMRGSRSFKIGCDIFFAGGYRASMPLFASAARHGHRPLKSLFYLPRAIIMELASHTRRVIQGTPKS
ncbi:glycosyltransferase family 2 protein [Massilia sp. X63]|uniref:glycosyltransferase family 2 protein n=1 Tax=Massilia sp. X63 TaxID=3237285 RepID=UPI0034DCF507